MDSRLLQKAIMERVFLACMAISFGEANEMYANTIPYLLMSTPSQRKRSEDLSHFLPWKDATIDGFKFAGFS
jgi:hypothetical protein